MEHEIKKRDRLRQWVKLKADRLVSYVAADNPRQSTLGRQVAEFDEKFHQYYEQQRRVEDLIPDEEAEQFTAEIAAADEFRAEMGEARDQAEELLMTLQEEARTVISVNQNLNSNVSRESSTSVQHIKVKLPKLELPHFNGKITEFPAFWDNFEAHVHNQELPVVSKFSYLTSLLDGEAKRVISGLSITSANYDIAINMLKRRYGDEDRIISAHIHALIMVSSPASSKGTKYIPELWKMYDDLNKHIKCLEALQITGTQYGRVLTPIILSRLPEDLRLEWSRHSSGHQFDLEFLMLFLEEEIKRLQRSDIAKDLTLTTDKKSDKNEKKEKQNTAAALHSSTSTPDTPTCVFCKSHITHQ